MNIGVEIGYKLDYAQVHSYETPGAPAAGHEGFPKFHTDWYIPHLGDSYVCPILDGHIEIMEKEDLRLNRRFYYDPNY